MIRAIALALLLSLGGCSPAARNAVQNFNYSPEVPRFEPTKPRRTLHCQPNGDGTYYCN